ncbi:hypothetical protein, partial [Pseudomonas protegens]|uniref:hypothetical protein n=1 Tax=Pseudomonas protegens TaxID=380021 RepID=UPI003906D33A
VSQKSCAAGSGDGHETAAYPYWGRALPSLTHTQVFEGPASLISDDGNPLKIAGQFLVWCSSFLGT